MATRQLATRCWLLEHHGIDAFTKTPFGDTYGIMSQFALDPVRQLFAWTATGEDRLPHVRHYAKARTIAPEYICLEGHDGSLYQFYADPDYLGEQWLKTWEAWQVNGEGPNEVAPDNMTFKDAARSEFLDDVPAAWLAQAAANLRAERGA